MFLQHVFQFMPLASLFLFLYCHVMVQIVLYGWFWLKPGYCLTRTGFYE